MNESPRTVLVIEDYDELRELTDEILRSAGYTVLAFSNGGSAIEAADRYDGPIHLLLTDVELPDIRGPEVAARLRPGHPAMKVLFMSGYAEVADQGKSPPEPGVPLIQKPFMAADLLKKVREMLTA